MYFCAVVILIFGSCVTGAPIKDDSKGYFWQVTDFHFDANYSLHGDPSAMCHYSSSSIHYNLGQYGDYKCDSPWSLVQSAIHAMSDIHDKPDFILWTGDSVPHVNDTQFSEDKIFSIIHNITESLMSTFPDTPIYPTFGNHDPYPTNQMPSNDQHYYSSILNNSMWDKLLPAGANETFLKGGYYSVDISPKLKLLCLNTALYYHSNNITGQQQNAYDPSQQLSWMAWQLEEATLRGQKVFIGAHVPPGVFELSPYFKWFHEDLNTQFLDVIDDYGEVISSHFYGHEHTDSFRVYGSTTGYSVMYLSPAVTPWKSTIPGVGSNNPSIRLYEYNKTTLDVIDYYQYYLNLTEANSKQGGKWKLEYQFTKAYDVPDLKPESVRQAAESIAEKSSGGKYLKRYLQYNSVSANLDPDCEELCVHWHKCSIFNLRYPQVERCLATNHTHHHHTTTPGNSHHHHHPPHPPHPPPIRLPKYMTGIIIGLAILLVILTIAVLVLCFRPRQHIIISRGHGRVVGTYGSISNPSSPTRAAPIVEKS